MPTDRTPQPDQPDQRDPRKVLKRQSGGGGMVGTVGDYARFSQMLLNGGSCEAGAGLRPETIALDDADHIGPETGVVRDQNYYPGPNSGFGLGFAVRTSVPANTNWPLGEYRWDGVGARSSSSIPPTICSESSWWTPSQRGRIQAGIEDAGSTRRWGGSSKDLLASLRAKRSAIHLTTC